MASDATFAIVRIPDPEMTWEVWSKPEQHPTTTSLEARHPLNAGLVTIANESSPGNRWWVIDFESQTPEPDRSISGVNLYDDGLFAF